MIKYTSRSHLCWRVVFSLKHMESGFHIGGFHRVDCCLPGTQSAVAWGEGGRRERVHLRNPTYDPPWRWPTSCVLPSRVIQSRIKSVTSVLVSCDPRWSEVARFSFTRARKLHLRQAPSWWKLNYLLLPWKRFDPFIVDCAGLLIGSREKVQKQEKPER